MTKYFEGGGGGTLYGTGDTMAPVIVTRPDGAHTGKMEMGGNLILSTTLTKR